MAFGLALRVGWWLYAHPGPVSDYLGYRTLALRLFTSGEYARHGLPTAWRTPGYPIFLAAGMVVSRSDAWLSLLNVAGSTAAIPLTWWFARRLGLGDRIAVIAAVVVAVSPTLVMWSAVLGSENLQLPLLICACGLSCSVRRVAPAVLVGTTFGLASLVRPESLFYLLAVPAFLWFATPSWRRTAFLAVVVVGTCMVVVLPWYVRNEAVVGRGAGLSSTGGLNFYFAHREGGYGWIQLGQTPLAGRGEAAANREGMYLGWDAVAKRPLDLVSDIVLGTRELYATPHFAVKYSTVRTSPNPPYDRTVPGLVSAAATVASNAAWIVVAAMVPFGVFALFVSPMRRSALAGLLLLVVANWLCFTVVFWGAARYRFAIEPVLALFAAAGVNRLLEGRVRSPNCLEVASPQPPSSAEVRVGRDAGPSLNCLDNGLG